MNRNIKKRYIIAIVVLPLLAAGFFMRFPRGPRPMCHKQIDGAFMQWAIETGHTNDYPNVNGNGHASLSIIEPFMDARIHQYGYVPGLHHDDPNDLVLMYMKEKTRHSWHGDRDNSIFSPPKWMVLSPDILAGSAGEGGALVETPEFKRRLQLTVIFLKENQRPDWQTVADEQTKFLNSIKQ